MNNKSNSFKLTPLSEIGEFGWIERLKNTVQFYNKQTILGIGDDAAVIKGSTKQTLVSNDMFTEGIHFDLRYTPLKHLGYKIVATNISDICAMNAKASQLLVGIAVSGKFTVEALEALYQGINIACKQYKIDLIGGDTTNSYSGLTISVTMIGHANKNEIVQRDGAKVNDLVCVSGNLGAAYAGLQILEREKKIFLEHAHAQPDLSAYQYVIERQLKPDARTDIIQELLINDIRPTAMLDVSDGLAADLQHICRASKVGVRIDAEKIPIDQETLKVADELNLPAITFALNGGEDYELAFTVSQDEIEKVNQLADVSIVGYITKKEEGCTIVDSKNNLLPLSGGWDGLKAK